MSKTYDLEDILFDVMKVIKANFNNELVILDGEKADGVTSRPISDNAYSVLTMDDKIMNYADFIFIDVNAINSVPLGPVTQKTYTILILVITTVANDLNEVKRVLRYGKALNRVIEKNWDRIGGGIKYRIEEIPAQDVLLINSSKFHKTSGIQITGAIV